MELGEAPVAIRLGGVSTMRHLDQIPRRIVILVFIPVVDVVFGPNGTPQEFGGEGPVGVSFSVAHNDISGLSACGFEPYTIMPHL